MLHLPDRGVRRLPLRRSARQRSASACSPSTRPAAKAVNADTIRLAERHRIARILHDELLQSVHALSLQVQVGINSLPAGNLARQQLNAALDRADELTAHTLLAIQGLRSPDAGPELSQALREALQIWRPVAGQVVLDVRCIGTIQPLQAPARQELFWIVREGGLNALRHARARTVDITVAYRADALVINVLDDGRGLATPGLRPKGSPGHWGHWGLTGMQERAALIGATLRLESRPHAGTRLRLYLPAALAYQPIDATQIHLDPRGDGA